MHVGIWRQFQDFVTQCQFHASISMHVEISVTHLKANNL